MSGRVAVVLSTYNNEAIIEKCIRSCLEQSYSNIQIVAADDGSTDSTLSILTKIQGEDPRLHIISLPHGERGTARKAATDMAETLDPEYIYIIDSDMILQNTLSEKCVKYLMENDSVGGLVIPELAFSDHENFFSRVKVFERNVVNRAGEDVGDTSIEAARFWKHSEYRKSGGINSSQIAFEETQPTIRYLGMGGCLKRAVFTGVAHDEKMVTLKNILDKKRYYFSVMDKTIESEEEGLLKVLKRWYFFRGVLYRGENLREYVKHPILTLGMIYMYICLTLVWLGEVIRKKRKKINFSPEFSDK